MKKYSYDGMGFSLHLFSVVGSTLHGLNNENSDVDYKGVFTWDKKVLLGMSKPLLSLDKNNTNKDEWELLLKDLNKDFGLNLTSDDDLVLFSAKEFFNLSYKNDSNMFDMLFNDNDKYTLLESEDFKELKKHRKNFVNNTLAFKRFFGMANNTLSEAKKGVKTNKNLSKSLQMFYSLELLLKNGTFLPELPLELKQEVLNVKNGVLPLDKCFEKVENFKLKLDSFQFENNDNSNYKDFMDDLLVNLHKN